MELANAEQARKEALERAKKADMEFEHWQNEAKRLSALLKRKLIQLGLESATSPIGNFGPFRRILSKRPGGAAAAAELAELRQELDDVGRKAEEALEARRVEDAEAAAREGEIKELLEQMAAAGCD